MSDELELNIGGANYTFTRVGFGIRIDAEEEVRKQRRNEFREMLIMLKDIPATVSHTAVMTAMDMLVRNVSVTITEVRDWLNSPSGEVYSTWKSLKAKHPETTLEQTEKLITEMSLEQYADLGMFIADGMFKKDK